MSTDEGARPIDPRSRPAGMSLADLIALVAGAALALGTTGYPIWGSNLALGRSFPPGWFFDLLIAKEIARKGCLALVPVVLARKARNGGPVRPGEFAALCVGVDLLLYEIHRWPGFGILSPRPGRAGVYGVDLPSFCTWHGSALVASALAIWVLAARHRRLTGWASGLLLCAGWFGLSNSARVLHQEGFDTLVESVTSSIPTAAIRAIDGFGTAISFGALWRLPIAFAALDVLRPFGGRTWGKRVGVGLGIGLWVVLDVQASVLQSFQYGGPWWRGLDLRTSSIVTPLLTILLAFVLAHLLGPTLRRWLGLADGPQLVPGGPAAMMESSPTG